MTLKKTVHTPKLSPPKYSREAGVLMPVSSLSSPHGIGDLGPDAHQFVEDLHSAGQRMWPTLPLNPTSVSNSPYQSPCTFAGNPYLISPQLLLDQGLLLLQELEACDFGDDPGDIDYGKLYHNRPPLLKKAHRRWLAGGGDADPAFARFQREQQHWLEDYALFEALKQEAGGRPWSEWEPEIRDRQPAALQSCRERLRQEMDFVMYCQYEFSRQWADLLAHARRRDVRIVGDLPFYVALDSSDVWVHRELFLFCDDKLSVALFGGVPPDYFSDRARSWGNPIYDWEEMERTGFEWWRQRVLRCADLYDVLRIDHAIGLVRFYGIPGENSPIAECAWYEGPDAVENKLTAVIARAAGERGLEIIAEDLGSVNDRLRDLLVELEWSGMRVLQFAFTGGYGAQSSHLPHFYSPHTVVYTGTHDNETLVGYLEGKTDAELGYMKRYLRTRSRERLPWRLIEEAYHSCAEKAVVPMQDLLGLDNRARVCYSDSFERSWRWRMSSGAFTPALQRRLRRLARDSGR